MTSLIASLIASLITSDGRLYQGDLRNHIETFLLELGVPISTLAHGLQGGARYSARTLGAFFLDVEALRRICQVRLPLIASECL